MNSHTGQAEVTLAALAAAVAAVGLDLPAHAFEADDSGATTALDELARQNPILLVLALTAPGSAAAAERWAASRGDWLILTDPPPGLAVLAPVTTVAGCALPGRWRGAQRPAPVLSTHGARAALVDPRRDEADRLRATLASERTWVAAEALRVRDSQSWRLGHRLVRTARLLTLRSDRGTDALSQMAERMTSAPDP